MDIEIETETVVELKMSVSIGSNIGKIDYKVKKTGGSYVSHK